MSRYTVTIIRADGSSSTVQRNDEPKLEELQGAIGGGYIEEIPHFDVFMNQRCVAYADEDGISKRLPPNQTATKYWRDQLGDGPFRYEPQLLGTICIVRKL